MDKELKAKWVAALRSGEYKQGYQYLKTEHDGEAKYCCLGVLCEVLEVPSQMQHDGHFAYYEPRSDDYVDRAGLPTSVAAQVGLDGLGHFVGTNSLEYALAYENDHGSSFNFIATIIEQHLPED